MKDEKIKWEQWSMPQFNSSTKKWFFRHEDADGNLIRLYDGYSTEAKAMTAHKRLFVNAVMGEQGLRAA